MKAQLLSSLLLFTQVFYKIRTGRDFKISKPLGRISHYSIIDRYLTKVEEGSVNRLLINIPPRYGKTELLIHFVAWTLARYPDSNYLYISSSKDLATRATAAIRELVSLPSYRKIFDVRISDTTSAKDHFQTTAGGNVEGIGANGTIIGKGAGIKGRDEFGGAIIVDDIIQASDATSDTVREGANNWHFETLISRLNNPAKTPIIGIGQRLHEHDYFAFLEEKEGLKKNGGIWDAIILPAIDVVGNALDPSMHTVEQLKIMQETEPYNYSSQYLQNPQPSGGGIFKPEWFSIEEDDVDVLATFITCDTAATDKTYNDPTVFSFFGLYKISNKEAGIKIETDIYGLLWINCVEIWVEPKDLESEFISFYSECMRYKVKPDFCVIERASTGITLASTLSQMRGLQVIGVNRTKASGSKTERFLEIQPFIAKKLVSFPKYGKHNNMCIEHCRKITANNTHLHDDIADTLYDGVKSVLIDKVLLSRYVKATDSFHEDLARTLSNKMNQRNELWRS